MDIASALLILVLIWVLVFLVAIQIRPQASGEVTQEEAGEVVPGTPASAPTRVRFGRRLRITTLVALILWAGVMWVVTSGAITFEDLDIVRRFGPGAGR
ncbi:DUF1467 family protein [Acidimangrovimonas sediminis]|uniref:DUF1467 family protein n=1 Tax=Acidimangrovimonas sediminis TaxID=2056283 RepID=UPI000C80F03C|nr:DUF1467 family protein [Acidimangrovimonas sediminis]